MERFAGTCEALCSVQIEEMAAWIAAIPFSDWHQQRPVDDQLRPAMMTDLSWHGFGETAGPVVTSVMEHFPSCRAYQLMLSVVMPGHSIEPHKDWQGPSWVCRVHVPLTTNEKSRFVVGGVDHNLQLGLAYQINTESEHSVTNDGPTPRVHFMFDVGNP